MFREISHLLLYRNLGPNSILVRLADIFRNWEKGGWEKDDLIQQIYEQVKRISQTWAISRSFFSSIWIPCR